MNKLLLPSVIESIILDYIIGSKEYWRKCFDDCIEDMFPLE